MDDTAEAIERDSAFGRLLALIGASVDKRKGNMIKKTCLFGLFGLIAFLTVGASSLSLSAQEDPYLEVGKFMIPKDLEWNISILPAGEYLVGVFRGRRSEIVLATAKPDASGMTYSWSIDAEVTETKESAAQPRVETSVVTEEGEAFVEIRVFTGTKLYKGLWKCAADPIDPSRRAKEEGPLDPAVENELALLREVHVLLDRFATRIWPGWSGYKTLDYILRFPNRDVVIVTLNQRLPARFKVLAGWEMNGKSVYIDRTRELPGRIAPAMSIGGHGDMTGVTANLLSTLETAPAGTGPQPKGEPGAKSPEELDREMRLTRMMVYVHEAYHVLQANLMVEASKAGLAKKRPAMDRDFDANLEYSVYADIQGKALLRAYREKNKAKALEAFKEAIVAGELKRKAMPPGAAAADEMTTRSEGTATYANLMMARLIDEKGYRGTMAKDNAIVAGALATIDAYLKKEGTDQLERVSAETLDVTQKPYTYGAFEAFLLDRFSPKWKAGLFEKDRTLDEVMAELLPLSVGDKDRIAGKIKAGPGFRETWDRHDRIIKDRDETVQAFASRKGRKYVIDLRRAQRGVDINPREASHVVMYQGAQFFPHGLVKFVYGGLSLESKDTPIRLPLMPRILEWIDTEAAPGEKGYDLTFGEKADDLYRNVTLKTRGFTMTAKGIKIAEKDDTVTISIID